MIWASLTVLQLATGTLRIQLQNIKPCATMHLAAFLNSV